jgi:hypothetical protein
MIRDTLRDEVLQKAGQLGFGGAAKLLLNKARECVYIFNDGDRKRYRVGASRLGGAPDLPNDSAWPPADSPVLPGHKGWPWLEPDEQGQSPRYAEFLAQFALAEIPDFECRLLPDVGHLCVFVSGWRPFAEVGVPSLFYTGERLVPQSPPAVGISINRLVEGSASLRFQVGVSLPFGNTAFREAISYQPHGRNLAWELLAEALKPSGSVGQIGGFAFSYEGCDLRRDMVLGRLGRRDYIAVDQYDSIADLEESARRVPYYIRNEEERKLWIASYEKLRPAAKWIEQHQHEIQDWQLAVMIDDDSVGNSLQYPLWIFAHNEDMRLRRFDRLIGVCAA